MKKRLLLGTALFAAISAFPQAGKVSSKVFAKDMSANIASKYQLLNIPIEKAPTVKPSQPTTVNNMRPTSSAASTSTVDFQALSGSMNIYGMLVSTSRPLQYNDELDAVSFIHRKSATYQPDPFPTPVGAETGAIVGMVTTDWGNTWDSTLIWNDNTNWARYPQGGLYNPVTSPANNDIANAYIIATGPLTPNSGGWVGNFFASKPLDIPNGPGWDNVASTVPGAQQFISNTAPFGAVKKTDFARLDFAYTDDGAVRAMGIIANDVNLTTTAGFGYRGASIVKGTFNSGTFTWASDSVIPATHVSGVTGGKQVFSSPHMAWNESGTVGYVFHIGVRPGQTGSNVGLQPIVYKTTNGGTSWALMNNIDFNDPALAHVVDHIGGTANDTNIKVPTFNVTEGIDGIVDANDRLHIFATVFGATNNHPDSIFGSWSFQNYDGETYTYAHGDAPMGIGVKPGHGIKPYLYDFYETATGWNVTLIDSMGSEAPGIQSGDDGYNHNPWDPTGGSGTDKVDSDARLQMSRTPDGQYIVYSWAETDTTFSSGTVKWNISPDIHARVKDITTGAVHPVEVNVSGGSNLFVSAKAFMYYMSPKCAYATQATINGPVLKVPYTISNNQNVPLTQLLPNTHWYASAILAFGTPVSTVSVSEHNFVAESSAIYPNPATGSTNLSLTLKNNSDINITIVNTIGQAVKSVSLKGEIGENVLPLDVNGLSSGIYLVNVKVGEGSATKKLVIE